MKRLFTYPTGISRRILLAGALFWTFLVSVSLYWNCNQIEKSTMALAKEDARSSFNKDLIFRLWNSEHGGVYVPITEQTPPNPYLSHMPERDVTTITGMKLTLINPAYMTRQVHTLGLKRYGARGHITSLNPIRPENAADKWETTALRFFENGIKEVVSEETIEGQSHLRLMRPLITDKSCLKCHAAQGYQEDDIRGGISVSIPLAPYHVAAAAGKRPLILGHLLIWTLGLAGLGLGNMLRHRLELARHAEYEHMIGQISSNFVRLAPGKADQGIERAMAAIGDFTGADHVYVYQIRNGGERMVNTHNWCGKSNVPQIEIFQDLASDDFSWLMGKLRRFEILNIRVVADLPPEAVAEKKIFDLKGIQSFVGVPLVLGSRLHGFLGADILQKGRAWTERDLIFLQLVGEIIIHALDRDRAEKALANQTKRLNHILHGTNVGTWEWNVQTGEMVLNERWAEIIGFTLEEISPLTIDTCLQFSHPEDLKVSNKLLQECFSDKKEYYNCEARMRHKNGDWVWVQDRGKVATWTDSGKPEWMYGTRADINRQKRQEQERRKMYEQLQHTQRLESLGVLAGGIAHDFNNILMAIMGNAELALHGIPGQFPESQNLSEIVSASKRAAELCGQMLAYSGKGSLEKQYISMGFLIEETLNMLKASISKKSTLELNIEKRLPHMLADPTQVRQILMNLVINASEAIGDFGGVITISTGSMDCSEECTKEDYTVEPETGESYVYFKVSDTGPGIDPQTVQHIFEPFFTTKFTGRGLGLSAVVGIVRSHKGALQIHSEPGHGSTFKVLFPAVKIPIDEIPVTAETGDWHGQGTVLLVDDEESVRGVTGEMLRRLGLNVVTAMDGRQAVEMYRRQHGDIAVVLIDLMMPNMNGEEAFQELRKINPNVRVILASGYSEGDVDLQFTGKGFAGRLQKPYNFKRLRSLLSRLLPEAPLQDKERQAAFQQHIGE